MKTFDLVLVLGYFRSVNAFLSIIRALSPRFRIAVLSVSVNPAYLAKTTAAQTQFIRLCRQFGAEIVEEGEPIEASLAIVQQFPYPDETVARFMRSVRVKRRVGMMLLAMAGLDHHDAFLEQFGIRKVYVPSRRLMAFLLAQRNAEARYSGVEIVEVGLPFGRYPVFPEFQTDWLIAVPTLFSFHTERGKQHFLRTVLRLLEQIPQGDIVVYKPHNGTRLDYFALPKHHAVARWVCAIPGARSVLSRLSAKLTGSASEHVGKILTCCLYIDLMKRAVPMMDVSPHSDMSLEAFLPGVRKGVIGGLSNTTWGALYFGLPFYNCVDPALRGERSELLNKNSEPLLDLNMKFFGVPYCEGRLDRGATGPDIVRSEDRAGDLIAAVLDDLALAGKAAHSGHDQVPVAPASAAAR